MRETDEIDGDAIPETGPRKRSLSVRGRATSISLTDEMWAEFRQYAADQNLSLNQLASRIRDGSGGTLNRAVRLYIINRRLMLQSDRA